MIAQVKDAKRRTRFANACRGLPVLDALLPLDCALFRKSQPWRFYAGPTLALELSGSTAWLAGHANPAELAGFLSFCGCESAILDEAVCPPPDGWRKAETLTVFALPQAGPLPLPAVDEALWAQLSLCREAPAARVAAALYQADLTRQADFYSELCTKRSRGRAVAWTLEQGSTAALIYTAGTVAEVPKNLMGSGRTLALHMYVLSGEGLHMNQASATAVVILAFVLVINFLSGAVAKRIAKG